MGNHSYTVGSVKQCAWRSGLCTPWDQEEIKKLKAGSKGSAYQVLLSILFVTSFNSDSTSPMIYMCVVLFYWWRMWISRSLGNFLTVKWLVYLWPNFFVPHLPSSQPSKPKAKSSLILPTPKHLTTQSQTFVDWFLNQCFYFTLPLEVFGRD